ncbi:hypothetical protein GCM10020255_048550 [Rhodococcus baikonurensis]
MAFYFGWRALDTYLVGRRSAYLADGRFDVEIEVDPQYAGATIALTRKLVLERDRLSPLVGEARHAGSILWNDEQALRLTGSEAMFPTEVVDFDAFGIDEGASWHLRMPLSPDEPAMRALLLLINPLDKKLVKAVQRRGTIRTSNWYSFKRWKKAWWTKSSDGRWRVGMSSKVVIANHSAPLLVLLLSGCLSTPLRGPPNQSWAPQWICTVRLWRVHVRLIWKVALMTELWPRLSLASGVVELQKLNGDPSQMARAARPTHSQMTYAASGGSESASLVYKSWQTRFERLRMIADIRAR